MRYCFETIILLIGLGVFMFFGVSFLVLFFSFLVILLQAVIG